MKVSGMAVQSLHPSAFELAFRLYDRAIHPELIDAQFSGLVQGVDWRARLSICPGGHVVELRSRTGIVTELAVPDTLELPDRGLTAGHKLGASRDWTVPLPSGVHAWFSAHIDALDPASFRSVEQELVLDARKAAVAYQFPGFGRSSRGRSA